MDFCEIVNKEVIELIFRVLFMIIMLIAAICDFREKTIPISIPSSVLFLSLIYWLYLWSMKTSGPKEMMFSLIPGIILIAISCISRKNIGIGDGLMIFALGPFLGLENLMLTIMIAFLFSAIVGGTLLILRKASGKTTLAFMPFLTAGMGVTCFVLS